jgi:type II secretory pathway pseudopilin PulG
MNHMSPRKQVLGTDRGFTALEALITAVVFSVILLLAVTTFQGSNRLARSATVQGDSQQSARLAIDVVTRDLRSLGYGIDVGLGQLPLAYAAPWDIIFNANVLPAEEAPGGPRGFPRAIDLSLAPVRVPSGGGLYVPTADFQTGAETIRYTIDSSGDGILSEDDLSDDPEEATPNPWDFVLKKEIYGALPGGTNGGVGMGVGLIRGPGPDPDGTLPTPLFTYWLDDDDDPITPPLLHGDTNGDGQLSQAEIAVVGPVPSQDLPLVNRVVITITAEDGETGGRPDYRSRELVSSVSFRNLIRRVGVITGTVFLDANSDGEFDPQNELPIPRVLVRLDTGAQYLTDETGRYAFRVPPGTYTVTEVDPPAHSSTTPNVATVSITTGSVQIVDFGDRATAGMGAITGTVYFGTPRT